MPMTQGELAYVQIRDRIVSGELAAGAFLKETELAEEMRFSRTPVREALRRLSESGLVEMAPNRRARVIGWSEDQMSETYDTRAVLESYAAQLAATVITRENLEHLAMLIEEMDNYTNTDDNEEILQLARLNHTFHQTVLHASGNKQLVNLVTSVSQVPMLVRDRAYLGAEFRKRANHQHRDIFSALRTRDAAWAEVAMRSHILAARNAALNFAPVDT